MAFLHVWLKINECSLRFFSIYFLLFGHHLFSFCDQTVWVTLLLWLLLSIYSMPQHICVWDYNICPLAICQLFDRRIFLSSFNFALVQPFLSTWTPNERNLPQVSLAITNYNSSMPYTHFATLSFQYKRNSKK